jgi:hypothetical protein
MKRVVEGEQVAHLWAHKTQPEARSGGSNNFYFEGDIIYSYGRHFPIARHVTNKRGDAAILFTTRDYSVTTSGHKNMVQGAIPPGVPVFFVERPEAIPSTSQLDEIQERINQITLKAERARQNKDYLLRDQAAEIRQFKEFAAFIGSKRKPKIPGDDWLKEQKELARVQADKDREARKERERREVFEREALQIQQKEQLESWLNGGNVSFPYAYRSNYHNGNSDYLRLEGDEVVTSRAARVPAEHVRKVAPLVVSLIEAGKTYQHNGHSIHLGEYIIDSIDEAGSLRVGCHTFKKEEVLRFVKVLGGVNE